MSTIIDKNGALAMDKFKVRIHHFIAAFVCLILALACTSVAPARAAGGSTTVSAADFVATCSTSPTFTVDTDTIVTGSATLDTPYGNCWVHLAAGANLTFEQVVLNSKTSSMGMVVDGEDGAQVHVHQSTIVLGGLFLEPGGHEPGHPDANNGLLEVAQSTLRVTNDIGELRLLASACADGGRVVVNQSDLSAPSVVLIAAGVTSAYHGCAGTNGSVQVAQSSIAGSNPKYGVVQIDTGKGGATSASQNTFAGVSAVWSTGGSCKSVANIPETPCS